MTTQGRFFERAREIERIIAAAPSEESADRFRVLAGEHGAELHRFAFEHLDDERWIEPLFARGYFRQPPAAINTIRNGYITAPSWPESQFLVRVADRCPELVHPIVLSLDPNENSYVAGDIAAVGSKLAVPFAATIAARIATWVDRFVPIFEWQLSSKVADLIVHLARHGLAEEAMLLARAAFAIQIPRSNRPGSAFHLSGWSLFARALTRCLPELNARVPWVVFAWLIDQLAKARTIGIAESDHGLLPSMVWRPRIEASTSRSTDIRDALTSQLIETAKSLASAGPDQVSAVIQTLSETSGDIFQRIALHVLRLHAERVPELVRAWLEDPNTLEDTMIEREYLQLLSDRFAALPIATQQRLLDRLVQGPRLEISTTEPDAQAENYRARWRYVHLAAVAEHLGPSERELLERLAEEVGSPKTSSADHRPRPRTRPSLASTPVSVDQLAKMTPLDVSELLRRWVPPTTEANESVEGLAREVQKVVERKPVLYAEHATLFLDVDPQYCSALLDGLIRSPVTWSWDPILTLCEKIVGRAEERHNQRHSLSVADLRSVLTLLYSRALVPQPGALPFDARPRVWRLLMTMAPLAPVEEWRRSDWLNTIGGLVLLSTISYASWIARHLRDRGETFSFADAPEVAAILERHLADLGGSSPALHALFGQELVALYHLDAAWVAAHRDQIFPLDEKAQGLLSEAWNNHVVFSTPDRDVLPLLRHLYERTASQRFDDVDPADDDSGFGVDMFEERFAYHLLELYLQGAVNLEDSTGLLSAFFQHQRPEARAKLLDIAGMHLIAMLEGPRNPERLDRIKTLWDWREPALVSAPEANKLELKELGAWFGCGLFDDDWSLTSLARVLELVGEVSSEYLVAAQLARLSERHPFRCAECVKLWLTGDPNGWFLMQEEEQIVVILENALFADDVKAQDAAEDIIHTLGTRGFFEMGALLDRRIARARESLCKAGLWGANLFQRFSEDHIEVSDVRRRSSSWIIRARLPSELALAFALAPEILFLACAGEPSLSDFEWAAAEFHRAAALTEPELIVLVGPNRSMLARASRTPRRGQRLIRSPGPNQHFEPVRALFAEHLFQFDVFEMRDPVRWSQVIGRRPIIADLSTRIRSGQAVGLFGLRKAGKTSVLRAVTDRLDPISATLSLRGSPVRATEPPEMFVVWIDLQGLLTRTLDGLCSIVERALRLRLGRTSLTLPAPKESNLLSIETLIDRALQESDVPLCIAFDEYDLLFDGGAGATGVPEVEKFLGLLRARSQETGRLGVAVIGRDPTPSTWPELGGYPNPMFGWILPKWIGPLDREEADELLTRLGARTGLNVGPASCARAFEWTAGHAMLHRQFGSALLAAARSRNTDAVLAPSDPLLDAALDDFLERSFVTEFGNETFLLLSTRYPASFQLLIDLINSPQNAAAELLHPGAWGSSAALVLRRFGLLLGTASSPRIPEILRWYSRTIALPPRAFA